MNRFGDLRDSNNLRGFHSVKLIQKPSQSLEYDAFWLRLLHPGRMESEARNKTVQAALAFRSVKFNHAALGPRNSGRSVFFKNPEFPIRATFHNFTPMGAGPVFGIYGDADIFANLAVKNPVDKNLGHRLLK